MPLPNSLRRVNKKRTYSISQSTHKVTPMSEEIRANLHKGGGFRNLLETHGMKLGNTKDKETVLGFLRAAAMDDLKSQLGRKPTHEEYKTYLLALKHFFWKKDLGQLNKQDIEELLNEIQLPF